MSMRAGDEQEGVGVDVSSVWMGGGARRGRGEKVEVCCGRKR